MGIFGHNFRVSTSKKHPRIIYKNNEKSFVFLIKWGGGEIPLKQKKYLRFFFSLDFINFEKVILDILRPEIMTLVTLGKCVFSSDVICERPLVEIFIKNMTH